MASSPITSWQMDGETMETVTDFIFLGSKITAESNWSHEIKRHLLLWRKAITKLDSILKSRDITLPIKVWFFQCHIWMWEMDHKESWVPKNWCFCTVVFKETLESPLDCKRSNQSILKEISPGNSLEGLMPNLKLHFVGHLMWRTDSLEKTLMLGKIEGRRRRVPQRMRWLNGVSD